ncbi:uncharacterized protein LOC124270972, partial [Haliotis rubra]|uniref:uncharacterized protein LOC124270972 n=1 Tax=Haliotis rubra TaxID=36100 RepID=UPI001EE56E1B
MMKLKTLIFILQSLTVSGEYFYSYFTTSYVGAVDVCKRNGLQLVNLKTSEINVRVSAYMGDKSVSVWSGLHYNPSLSKFQWGDGQILHSADGLSWQGGQPDLSQGMECAYMKHISGSFIYKMTSCKTQIAALCDGELVTEDLPRAWPSFLRYTKRNSTESNQ